MPHPIKRKLLLSPNQFDPRSIPGLTLWLDAMDPGTFTFSTANDISQWNDKSGKANHMANGTANQQPLYVASGINGKTSVEFADDGTTKALSCNDNTSMDYTEFAAFAVIQRKADSGSNENILGKWKPTGNLREFRVIVNNADGLSGQVTQDGTNVRAAIPSGTIALDTPYIFDFSTAGATACRAAINHGVDGTQTMTQIFAGASPLTVGAHGDISERFAGYIGETLWYTQALTTAQRLLVLQYLSAKWGIAIS